MLFSYLFEPVSPEDSEENYSLDFRDSGPAPYSPNVVVWVEVERSGSGGLNSSLSYLSPSLENGVLIRTSEMPGFLLQRLIGLKEHSEVLLGADKNSKDLTNAYSLFENLS